MTPDGDDSGLAFLIHNCPHCVALHRGRILDSLLPRDPVPIGEDAGGLAEKGVGRHPINSVDRAGYIFGV